MKKRAQSTQYTIRGVPREVDSVLRRKAAQGKKSLNQVILDELVKATVGPRKHADFSDLVCRWKLDPGFDEIINSQRQIDREKWQ